ncbi:MAG: hypothetical protein M0P66_16490 [Salinivirgaceae bacterium]|nr:hypothetical protein [Salinivirgaceae bacterium]
MATLYVVMGLFLVFKFAAYSNQPQWLNVSAGTLFILYGGFRLFRTFWKKTKIDSENHEE